MALTLIDDWKLQVDDGESEKDAPGEELDDKEEDEIDDDNDDDTTEETEEESF